MTIEVTGMQLNVQLVNHSATQISTDTYKMWGYYHCTYFVNHEPFLCSVLTWLLILPKALQKQRNS